MTLKNVPKYVHQDTERRRREKTAARFKTAERALIKQSSIRLVRDAAGRWSYRNVPVSVAAFGYCVECGEAADVAAGHGCPCAYETP